MEKENIHRFVGILLVSIGGMLIGMDHVVTSIPFYLAGATLIY